MFVKQGHKYIAGASVPFFVTDSMLVSGGQSNGFSQIKIFDRDEFPKAQLPPLPQGSSNDWNTIAVGVRVAPSGNVSLPSEVRWVVDLTPNPVVAQPPPPPPPQKLPPFFPPSAPPPQRADLWPQVPNIQLSPPTSDIRTWGMPMAIGLGVVGGLWTGHYLYKNMFKEGLSPEERKNILIYVGSILALWGAKTVFGLNEWWLSVDDAAKKAEGLLP